MCMIAIRPAGAMIPPDIMEACWEQNPDLCGLAFTDGKQKVKIFRGLTFDELVNINVPAKAVAVYHFRRATSGQVDIHNSHPFPLFNNNLLNSEDTELSCEFAFAHNGIVRGTQANEEESDTLKTARLINEYFPNPESAGVYLRGIADNSKNRFALIGNNKVRMLGKFTQIEGIFFSQDWIRYYYYPYSQTYNRPVKKSKQTKFDPDVAGLVWTYKG